MGYIEPRRGRFSPSKAFTWDGHADFSELLFDSVFNYFPITFRPPPNDPYGITAQDLKDRLQTCISSNSLFAPFAFPALLDKLDSTSINVKVWSLPYLCVGADF